MAIKQRFLVSFMVDARGGAMRGCRHSGVRVIIPPRKAAMPMRITCRYLKKDKLVHAPPLMEGEALSSRILEMGPAGAKFLGPVIIEVPHFASLRGKEREIVILRSDNGETWREHTLEATEEAVQEVLNESFDGDDLKQLEDLNTNRITRILTTDFPQYFAIVTRIRQEVHAIGPEGGMVSSTVVPQVQAVFPQGALTKKIKVGLQAQPISPELVAKLLGNRVAVSPIVTVEPRRRKFHKPITLTIPVPQASSKGMINQYSGEAPTLRLLCSITGGTTRAQWEDVTGSTPLTFVNDCVSFTTTVSARFWLMDCTNIPEATRMATELYREAIHVPFMAKFVVFSKRHQIEEARVRVFCMTDDKEDKTLETQEQFIEVAKSRDVEVLEGKTQYLEFAGNLIPITKSGDQLAFNFYAFRENRLPFTIRVKDQNADPVGKILFMRQPKVGRGDPPQSPICNLNLSLPENVQPEPAPSEPDLLSLEKKYAFLSISKADTIHKADLRLTDISNMLSSDWVLLARELDVSESDINIIKSQYPENAPQQAVVMLRLWMQTSDNKASGNALEKALRKIGRDDIVQQCIFNVELVTDDIERAMAKAHLDQSGFDSLKRELGPSADTSLQRDASLDVSYDEKDLMKEAESAEEDEVSEKDVHAGKKEPHAKDFGAIPAARDPTYESEERKYAAEEKIISEEKVSKEESKSQRRLKGEKLPKEDIEQFLLEEKIMKEDRFSKEEKFSSQRRSEERTEKKGDEVSIKRKEEESAELQERLVEQKKEKIEETKIKHAADANLIETKMEEKEVYEEKIHEEKIHEERKSEEKVTGAKKVPPEPEFVTEVITQEKRSVPPDFEAKGMPSKDKSDLLQKLGEELGKLDEKLEEKFREKSRTHQPDEFTQASAEPKQMAEEPPILAEKSGRAPPSDVTHAEKAPIALTQPQKAADPNLKHSDSLHYHDQTPAMKLEEVDSPKAAKSSFIKPQNEFLQSNKPKKILKRSLTLDAELESIPTNVYPQRSKSLYARFPENTFSTYDSENDLFHKAEREDLIYFSSSFSSCETNIASNEVPQSLPTKDVPQIKHSLEKKENHPNKSPSEIQEPQAIMEYHDSACFTLEVKDLMDEVAKTKKLAEEDSYEPKGYYLKAPDLLYDQFLDTNFDESRLPTIEERSKESDDELISSAEENDLKESDKHTKPPEIVKPHIDDTGQLDEPHATHRINNDSNGSIENSSPKRLHPQPFFTKLGRSHWQRIITKHCKPSHRSTEKVDNSSKLAKQYKLFSNKDNHPSSSMPLKETKTCYNSMSTQTVDFDPLIQQSPHLYHHYVTLGLICREVKDMISLVEETFQKRSHNRLHIPVMLDRLDNLKQTILLSNISTDSDKTNLIYSEPLFPPKESISISNHLINNNFMKPTVSQKTMPIITGEKEKRVPLFLPNGEVGVGGTDENTDIEEVSSDTGELLVQIPKKLPMSPSRDSDGERNTDLDDLDISEEEIEAEGVKVSCGLEKVNIPSREIVNLTEGYARNASPLSSDQEGEYQDIDQRHRANILKSRDFEIAEEAAQQFTDSEAIEASEGEDIQSYSKEEDVRILQEHYGLNEMTDSHETVQNKPPMFSKCKKKHVSRSRKKNLLDVPLEEQEDTTEMEDLSGEENKIRQKPKKSKQKQHPLTGNELHTMIPAKSSEKPKQTPVKLDVTDTESLKGSSESDSDDDDDNPSQVNSHVVTYPANQDDYVAYSDLEINEGDIVPPPIEKEIPFQIPEPQVEQIVLKDNEAREDVPQVDTDEERFEVGESEDSMPLPPLQRHLCHPPEPGSPQEDDDAEGEDHLTDIEEMKVDESERDQILNEVINPLMSETNVLLSFETEAIDQHEKPEDKAPLLPKKGAVLNIPDDASTTDSEDLTESNSTPQDEKRHIKVLEGPPSHEGTDTEGIEGSDDDIPLLPPKKELSHIQFIGSDKGLMSIVLPPSESQKEDKVEGVIFLEPEGNLTDVEDVSEKEGTENLPPNTSNSNRCCSTDDELFEVNCPETPLPPDTSESTCLPSPKREIILIYIDKDGGERMTLEELPPDDQNIHSHEYPLTETEEVELPEEAVVAMLDNPQNKPPEIVIDFPSIVSSKEKVSKASKRLRHRKARRNKAKLSAPSTSQEEKCTLKEFLSGEEDVDSNVKHSKKDDSSSTTDLENTESGNEEFATDTAEGSEAAVIPPHSDSLKEESKPESE